MLKKINFEENPWPDIPHFVLKPAHDSDEACLLALLQVTENLEQLFKTHPDIDEEEPWFGWAFERGNKLQSELLLLESSIKDPKLHLLIDCYVQRVIKYFSDTNAEPGFYVHEEKEAGSDAIACLMNQNPIKYFERYIEFIKSVDLEHSVAQMDNIRSFKAILSQQQSNRLKETLFSLNASEYVRFT